MAVTLSPEGHVIAEVDGLEVTFLVDTGATLSLLNFDLPEKSLETVTIKGVLGVEEKYLSKPLPVTLSGRMTWAQFVISPTSPISLLGRDVLRELGTKLDLNSKGMKLYFLGNVLAVEREQKQKIEIPDDLKDIPSGLWSHSSKDIGFLKSAKPVVIKTKAGPPPSIKQYPIATEALPSLKKQIQYFIDEGILRPIISPYNTPILPVSKNRKDEDGNPEYRFVQDLRAINEHVEALHPVVPDPSLILTEIPEWSRWYTVMDLTGAFFSIPIAEESQEIFAFTWEGKQLTWTRLPQGFTSSPTLFSQILKNDLKDVILPQKSVLVQYVDDLLIASATKEACIEDTKYLCNKLYEKGHKVSLSKLQFCKPEVKYLGYVLASGVRKIDPERINAVQAVPRPITKKQMRAFLGQAGFCRPWIIGYSEIVKPLQEATKDQAIEPIPWTDEMQQAFQAIKQALVSAPALGLPDYGKPFTLYVTESRGIAKGVLVQKFGPYERPVAYYSQSLDPVVRGTPYCIRAVAAAAELTEKVRTIVLGHPLVVKVPHEVEILLKRYAEKSLSPQRAHRYEVILLLADNITLERSKPLNPATLLPDSTGEQNKHDCVQVIHSVSRPREDLKDEPLTEPELNLFTDGSSYYIAGKRYTGFAVTTETTVLLAESLPSGLGAQGAELIALCRAARLARGKKVNIYTDSKYAFGICHAIGMLWRERGFLTSAGRTIAHGELINDLLLAIQEPREIAVVYIPAHSSKKHALAKGNQLADAAARAAAVHPNYSVPIMTVQTIPLLSDPKTLYTEMNKEELEVWMRMGAVQKDGIWMIGDKPMLPHKYLLTLVRWYHERSHGGPGNIANQIDRLWIAPGVYAAARRIAAGCEICQKYGITRPRMEEGKRPPAEYPFQKLQIDFAEMPPVLGFKYMLVIVDHLSGWVEAFPTRKNDTKTVIKILLRDLIPRYGVPEEIDSDRGTHFVSSMMAELSKTLGITMAAHTPYHPQSSGKVERMNRTIKDRLGKVMSQTGLKWPDALPLVLWDLRTSPREPLKISPAEVLFGRVVAVPGTYVSAKTALLEGEENITQYLLYLQDSFKRIQQYAYCYQGLPRDVKVHDIIPGDMVMVKVFKRKHKMEPKWEGPYCVLLTSLYAIKVKGKEAWIHHTHVKKVSASFSSSSA